jgi:heat shock protein HslJ
MISPGTILAAATIACVCAACATQQADGPTSPSAPGRPPLVGTTWTATEIDGQPVDASEPQRRPSILLTAEGDRVSGSTGCNRISGTFTQQGSTLRFGALAMTRVACVPDRGAAENAFLAAIEGTASHTIDNQTLELRDTGGTVRMRLRAS